MWDSDRDIPALDFNPISSRNCVTDSVQRHGNNVRNRLYAVPLLFAGDIIVVRLNFGRHHPLKFCEFFRKG